jgi:hypoxanthine phosphoribosyltransferase
MNAIPPPEIEVLLSQEEIRTRVEELAGDIQRDFEGKRPVMVGVLQGAFVFMADLIRHLRLPLTVDFLRISSYGNQVVTTGEVKILLDLTEPIANRPVILVEDIVDTGITMDYLKANLLSRRPESLSVCSLLQKSANTVRMIQPIDYLGFTIPDQFVIGYGLDYAGHFRELPYLGVLPNGFADQ